MSSSLTYDSEIQAIRHMREWQVDGLIMISATLDQIDRKP